MKAPQSRYPMLGLLLVVVLAAALRWERIGQLSLVHFDEGVLVSGAFGVWLNGLWHFPLSQPLQAPPLFPWMVAATFGITGTTWPIMGIYLSAAFGVATVTVYFALLRRLYGSTMALAGTGLLAASDLHVAFSRMALTDVALTFWFVMGGYCLARVPEAIRISDGGVRNIRIPISHFRILRAVQLVPFVGWTLAFGLAAGAAWNTKYNGWMLIAIAATTWVIVTARDRLVRLANSKPRKSGQTPFANPRVLLAITVAGLIAAASFTPWYRYVERTYPGGYGAVTQNHLRYVAGLADWPSRAWRLWTSLAAFRHYGWLATVLASSAAIGCVASRGWISTDCRTKRDVLRWFLAVFLALAALAAMVMLGSDAVVFMIAAASVVPAIVWGRWPEILFAVWAGAFFVLTPFYHPYTRLLVPALPAAIALALWLITLDTKTRPNSDTEKTIKSPSLPLSPSPTLPWSPSPPPIPRCYLAFACIGVFIAGLLCHPFGWLPSSRIWQRWSTHESYRALGDAVLATRLPQDALVVCEGPPAMTLYVEREWTPLEVVPFQEWLARVEPSRDCYLAIDFWGAYAENHELALEAILERLHCLHPVAIVPNDLNLPTLLDYLPPAAIVQHLSSNWPAKHVPDVNGRDVVFPANLADPYADVIVLYRVDRGCLAGLLDRPHQDALK